MKEALERQGFNNTYLMTQPLAYWTSDCDKQGFIDLPEFPFGRPNSQNTLGFLQISVEHVNYLRQLKTTVKY